MTYEEAIEYATSVVEQWKDWVPESTEQYQFYKLSLEILEKVRDGKMIEPPCKVGDTVYMIINETRFRHSINPEICKGTVVGIYNYLEKRTSRKISCVVVEFEIFEDIICKKSECRSFSFEEFAKSSYKTKEEAEKALKEMIV